MRSLSKPDLAGLIDMPAVQSLLDHFYELVGIPTAIVDTEGRVLAGVGWQDVCARFHRVHPDTSRACVESDIQLAEGIRAGEFRLYKCKNHMWDVATPIVVGDRHVGNVYARQFFFDDEPIDMGVFREQAHEHGFDEAEYLTALERVPRLSRDRLNRALALFVKLAHVVSHLGDANLTRREAQEVLERERSLLETVMQATDVMLVYLDRDFNLVTVNSAYADTCRMTPEALVGRNHFALYPDAENEAIFRRVRDTGEAVFYKDKPFKFLDQPERGATCWDWSLVPVKDAAGRVVGLVFSLRETSKFKLAEQTLRRTERNASALLNAASESIWLFAPDGRILFANDTAAARFGKTPADLEGHIAWDYVPAHLVATRRARLDEVMKTAAPVQFEDERDGIQFLHSFYPVAGDDGQVAAVAAFSRDITERKRFEAELQAVNLHLAEADRRKDEFIAILSHELRNPLAPIRFALPLLHSQRMDDAGSRAVAIVDRQAGHLTRLVDDLLNVSRITSGKLELRCEHVTLGAVLTAATEAASPAIVAGRHTLKMTIQDEPIWLFGDPPRLAQIVTNLVDNSAKFTPHGGEIVLAAGREESQVVIRVRDNGMGIPAAAIETVFDMFRQVDRADKPQGGLGIGLALVQRLVEMHHGSIEAHSAGVGQGAEFVVRLPLAFEATAGGQAKVGGAVPATGTFRLKVLVVDDNADLVEMLAFIVEDAGHDVWKAHDGRSAISAALSYRPHVVLLDLGLPVMDGIEVARELRRHPELAGARLVAITGWGQAEDRRQTKDAGFDYHMTKPTDPHKIKQLLAEVAAEMTG